MKNNATWLKLVSKKLLAGLLTVVISLNILFLLGTGDFTAQAKTAYTTSCITSGQRVLFIGDSRTVDLFSSKKHAIKGAVRNNITVYAKDGAGFDYMVDVIDDVGLENFDVVVTWMGANDRGNFSQYRKYYKKLLKTGVRLILCTVGYSDNNKLADEGDELYYNNNIMCRFNTSLKKFAKKYGIETIDLYTYTKKHVAVQSNNGVHYIPKPTKKIWNYTVKKLIKLLSTSQY